ncbi:hypothetical protein F383_24591 [Gossypium arboreum]|uniref:Uncharacterized protein n=1 Tax=Gossypium arboreum TaxID=29729 RepID=A0A0B0P506_GOSAR|nr:hypothetical protein F383_24591 [Gossypium arboreum]
MAFMHPFVPG